MTSKPAPYNSYFVTEEDLQYAPPYLRDTGETRKEVKCEIKGTWPQWLSGTFIRVGGGRFTVPLSEDGSKPNAVLQHFFDGLALLHRFRFVDGNVFYASRSTHDGVVRKAKKDGYLQTYMFGPNANTPLKDAQDPCSTILGAQQSLYLPQGHLAPDKFNMNVVPRRGIHLPPDTNPKSLGTPAAKPDEEEILVHTDFNMLQVCDAKTLEPKRLLNYGDIDPELKGYGICAHPPKDRKRLWNFNYLIDQNGVLNIFAMDYGSNPAKLVWKTPLPCKPCYIHSLAISQDYVIFIRNPIVIDTSDMTKPFMEMMHVEANSKTFFYVLSKETGKHVQTYAAPHFTFFHTVNAYNITDPATNTTTIHVDLCAYSSPFPAYREYSLSNILDPAAPYQQGTLVRYALPNPSFSSSIPAASPHRAVVAQAIPACPMELPRINKHYSSVPGYRYVYACHGNGGPAPGTLVPIGRLSNGLTNTSAAFFGGIAKADWQTGVFVVWRPEGGESCPCEPVFVARPGGSEEDDGVVLTIVIGREGTGSVLVALDGRDLKEVARAVLPQVYGLGPHGSFIEGMGMGWGEGGV